MCICRKGKSLDWKCTPFASLLGHSSVHLISSIASWEASILEGRWGVKNLLSIAYLYATPPDSSSISLEGQLGFSGGFFDISELFQISDCHLPFVEVG